MTNQNSLGAEEQLAGDDNTGAASFFGTVF
jgi:hypothetical protein